MKSNHLPVRSLVQRIPLLAAFWMFGFCPVALRAAPPVSTVGVPADDRTVRLSDLNEKPPAAIQHYNLGADRLALGGYDPVSYHAKNQAMLGRKELSARHGGITYRFATEENKKAFIESPEKYLPAYGGWCATAMAKGEKVEIDPTNFKVTHGRLFLFFKAFYANALKDWNKDEANLIAKADAHWMKIAAQ